MTTKSREYLYGNAIRVAAERAEEARREADQLACKAWNMRMLGYKGRSHRLRDAILAFRCLIYNAALCVFGILHRHRPGRSSAEDASVCV
jgi:hypothetical protein